MQKVRFKNSRGLNLVGNFYQSKNKSVIIMCHGFTGDKSEEGRFNKTATVFNKEGFNVLNFDFSGSGESDDDSLTVDKQVDDLKCAIKFVLNKGLTNIGLLGLSLGGLISAKIYNQEIKTMVFWAPVTKARKYYEERFTSRQREELRKKGFITYTRDKGARKRIIIDKQMIIDRKTVNQEELLSRIKCPVLIIHGDKDERVPLEDSKSAIKYLSGNSKLKIIKNADHHFYEHLDQFIKLSVDWLKKYLYEPT